VKTEVREQRAEGSGGWRRVGREWWLTDFRAVPGARRKLHARALRGRWQTAAYRCADLQGVMLLANPRAAAPALRIPLPVAGRYSIALGVPENYCDRVLLKLARDRCFDKIAHGDVAAGNCLQEVWWRDVDLRPGDALILQQDDWLKRRCGLAYIRLYPALPATRPEAPLVALIDGFPGNNGGLPLDEMAGEELMFRDTHVSHLCHGTDICGSAQYNTKLPGHHYPADRFAAEELISQDYYPDVLGQLLKFERAGRCTLDESIAAAHSIGLPFCAYHRMGITRLYAPMRMFASPFYDAHPEWRCVDWDGTPLARLSIAFPGARRFFIEHFREVIGRGADGVCLVFARGWPLIMYEAPVAREYKARTGRDMRSGRPGDRELLQVRIDIFTDFMREIRAAVDAAAGGRAVQIVAAPLALPAINRHYGMDCRGWAREGLVQVFCPYPYGRTAVKRAVKVPPWTAALRGTNALLCPVLNRMTYAPAGQPETPRMILDRAERWLKEGADGFAVWDLDSNMVKPLYRRFACEIASAAGRRRLRAVFRRWPRRQVINVLDGITVDRYHPGWNV
jgi:hypothetical protein